MCFHVQWIVHAQFKQYMFAFFGILSIVLQSVSYRYREFFIFLVVSEPVSEKIGTAKKSRNRYRKNLVPEKSLGTGIGKIEYRKKVSEPVSRKFGTEKSTGIGIENIWYRIKVSVSVSFNILGTVTHWH